MGVWHRRSGRTKTGSRLRRFRGKRKHEMGRTPTETVVGETKRKAIGSKGKRTKNPALRVTMVNITDPKKKETYRVEIQDVEMNPASMDYQRRKVITRGTIIKTEKGRAKVTSRPGQDGVLNAVLI
ncbi:MAG: 30S ribosomal protein S8e [Candidatus Thorarchaeota archaeon SMTZ1-83]|jgi:small subunit ribosomal protein S8e